MTLFPACVERGVRFQDPPLLCITNVHHYLLCQQLCRNHPNCAYFDYVFSSRHGSFQRCCLRREGAVRYRTVDAFYVGGPPTCVPLNSSKRCHANYMTSLYPRLAFPGCIDTGFSYPGNDILVIHGLASAVLCQPYCSNHPTCSFFTWDSLTRVCFLKWGNATQTRIAAPGHSSGPSNCPPQNDTSFAVVMPRVGELKNSNSCLSFPIYCLNPKDKV